MGCRQRDLYSYFDETSRTCVQCCIQSRWQVPGQRFFRQMCTHLEYTGMPAWVPEIGNASSKARDAWPEMRQLPLFTLTLTPNETTKCSPWKEHSEGEISFMPTCPPPLSSPSPYPLSWGELLLPPPFPIGNNSGCYGGGFSWEASYQVEAHAVLFEFVGFKRLLHMRESLFENCKSQAQCLCITNSIRGLLEARLILPLGRPRLQGSRRMKVGGNSKWRSRKGRREQTSQLKGRERKGAGHKHEINPWYESCTPWYVAQMFGAGQQIAWAFWTRPGQTFPPSLFSGESLLTGSRNKIFYGHEMHLRKSNKELKAQN